MCTVLLPPGVNPIAVNHIISYHIIWYDMIWYMIRYMIWYDMIWYDMIWYDMIWYDMICLLTAIVLTPDGNSTVYIYTQTIHWTTQSTQTIHRTTQLIKWEKCGPCPVFATTTIADISSMQLPCTQRTYFIMWSWCEFVLVRNAWFNIKKSSHFAQRVQLGQWIICDRKNKMAYLPFVNLTFIDPCIIIQIL